MFGRHETLVCETDDDLRPLQRLCRQTLEEGDRTAPPGHYQSRQTVLTDRLFQALGDSFSQCIGQLLRSVEIMCCQPCWQLEVTYRHTRISRRE